MGAPLWEVWQSYQNISIPQQRALWGTPSSVVKLEKPTVGEVLAELRKIKQAKEEAAKAAEKGS